MYNAKTTGETYFANLHKQHQFDVDHYIDTFTKEVAEANPDVITEIGVGDDDMPVVGFSFTMQVVGKENTAINAERGEQTYAIERKSASAQVLSNQIKRAMYKRGWKNVYVTFAIITERDVMPESTDLHVTVSGHWHPGWQFVNLNGILGS